MYNRPPISQEQLEREKQLYLYFRALDRGDFEEVVAIMQRAQSDRVLEAMIMEAHAYDVEEEQVVLSEQKREQIQQLVLQSLPSGVWDSKEEMAIPPLTVGDVVTQLERDTTLPVATRQEVKMVSERMHASQQPLPGNLSVKSVYQMFEQLGVSVSTRVQKLFRDQAIFLARGREHGIAQLAATRRQQQQREQQYKQPKGNIPEGESQKDD
jgi:hypothetical protein